MTHKEFKMRYFFTGSLASERIAATGGRATGFDYMRFLLAISVILFHTLITSYGAETQSRVTGSPAGKIWLVILPMFFALSGFLVAGSLERSKSLGVFLGLRVLRIFPALAVDTLFCALILGPLLTTLALSDYFGHPEFRAYLLNIVGDIHFTLPGVFETNPSHKVNGQLWTIPVELECYIVLTALALIRFHRRRWLMLGVFLVALTGLEGRVLMGVSTPWDGRLLLLCFLCGVVAYLYRDRVRLSLAGAVLAVGATALCMSSERLYYLECLPLTYLTVCLGLLNPPKSKFLESGDYSYGLFLYGYPLQQVLVAWVPAARDWYWNVALAVPLALVFSVMSWHLIEKRVMARKHLLFAANARWEAAWQKMRKALWPGKAGAASEG
jgi:peptidoglycan/LPS O-acetylase OafA/YrhL